ncbi:MoaF-related domain-containing protein [Sinorhizobium chiapasense]|uniref:Adenylate cyclase n=1 Tax=Sinorhizobium chiapasense TaxID=501572 RepID=A0ABZ2BEP4_9HYPH
MFAFPFAGRTFEVDYGDLVATNAYSGEKNSLTYEITDGPLKGATAEVAFEWKELDGGTYVISWQEADGSTVVHVDNFERGSSLTFFTTPQSDFYRLSGTLRPLADQK